MSNKTDINPDVHITQINPYVHATDTDRNDAPSSVDIGNGTVIGGKYTVISQMDVPAGEADLFICKYDGIEYIAKLYRRKRAIKPEVVRTLSSVDSPYVAKLYDIGEFNGFPFEILPYYRNGSLHGKKFSFEALKENIIPCINEALHALHKNGIVHKDLKPSNIMLLDNGKDVAIIDFGISSVTDDDNAVLVTTTGMTPEYSAPETFCGLFLGESDYYSFGITLYELFCGSNPYKNMSEEEISRFTVLQRIPLPEDMPEELRDLISAVTYHDITGKDKKSNPNRRWTYEEVKNWCNGKKQVLPGDGNAPPKVMPPYIFMETEYRDVLSLINALGVNWNEGKKQLYRGKLSAFFSGFDPSVAGFCAIAEDEASKTIGKDDIIFWKLLYKICPEIKPFYWCGKTYASLPSLGREMLESLWKDDLSDRKAWDEMLSQKLLSLYLTINKIDNTELFSAVSALEAAHALQAGSNRDIMINYYLTAYLLSGQRVLNIDGKQIKSVPELTAYMKALLDSSYKKFEIFCHKTVGYDGTLDIQLESWLIAIGKRNELDAWRKQLSQ